MTPKPLLFLAFAFLAVQPGIAEGQARNVGRPSVKFTPTALSFNSQTVGTTSPAQKVTLTNAGNASLSLSKISVTGNFSQTNNCGSAIRAGSSCTINVTFAPATAGSLSGALNSTDNASGSPQSVSLSGTGSSFGGGGNGSGCGGTPITQLQTNVTSQLSYANTAAGVAVTQLTDNGTNRFYYFDVPAYSSAVNDIFYVDFVAGNEMVTAGTQGAGAQVVSPTLTGSQGFLSDDGKLAYYNKAVLGGKPGGADLYGILLNTSGICQEVRLTNLDQPPQAPNPVWQISTASPDPAGGYDIAVAPDTFVHRVHILANGTSQMLTTITLNDPESGETFHRIRLNPKFPNILMYKRNASSQGTSAGPEVWLVDLNTCTNGVCAASQIVNVVAGVKTPPGRVPKGGHIAWSPDGLDIAFSEPDIADYWLAQNVVNANGTLNTKFTLLQIGPFGAPGIPAMTADYCTFPPAWPSSTIVACLAGPASPVNAKTLYLMSTDGKGTTKLLSATDALVATINGTPMPQFAQDGQHLMFNSDRTGLPQVYMVSGFTLTVP